MFYEIIGIFQNEDEAIEKDADIMQDIEAYVKTFPEHDEDLLTDDEYEPIWRKWNKNFPHKIKDTDEKIDTVYVKEFDLL